MVCLLTPDFPRQIVAVTLLVENESREILMIKSTYKPGWEPVGGQVELGEDLIAAAVRETKEESGYDVVVTALAGIYQNTGSGRSEPKIIVVFWGKMLGGRARTSDESSAVGWFSRQDVLPLIEQPSMKERVIDALNTKPGQVVFKAYHTLPEFTVTRTLLP